jgi:hypothetical protein
MSNARLKRLARLESRRPSAKPWTDDSPWIIPIFEAMFEGRPFSWLPSERELSPEEEAGIERILRDTDRVAARLQADDPEVCAKMEADRKRRLNATLRAIEREQAEREAA